MIPNICHFVWFAGPLPAWAQTNLASFKTHNPQVEVRLHTDDSLLQVGYQTRWEQAKHPATRADMLRYSILHHFGGLYFDLDWFHINPLPTPVDDGKLQCVQMHPGRPVNSAMACAPGLPVFRELQLRFVRQRPAYMTGTHVLSTTYLRQASLFSPLKGTWCDSGLQNVGIYCHAHHIALLEINDPPGRRLNLGDWQQYTAVHLSSAGAVAEVDHARRARRMYMHFIPFAHLLQDD